MIESHLNNQNNPYLYNGKELDAETGFYYYGARYYEPKSSLWLSVDPLAEKFLNFSPYAYTFNNPVMFVDPTGMEGEDWFENTKTGEIYYNSEYKKGDESKLGGDWKWMKENNTFSKSDNLLLAENSNLISKINHSPIYDTTTKIPQNPKITGITTEAIFNSENSQKFMSNLGYDFRELTSYSSLTYSYPVNQILPGGGSVVVENISGIEIITERMYILKDLSQNSKLHVFWQKTNPLGYETIYKTNYTYSKSIFSTLGKGILRFLFRANDAMGGDHTMENNSVERVYSWELVTDKKLLKYKNQ